MRARQFDQLVHTASQLHLLGHERGAPLERQRRHRDAPAVVDLADDVGHRDAHLVVEDFAEVVAA